MWDPWAPNKDPEFLRSPRDGWVRAKTDPRNRNSRERWGTRQFMINSSSLSFFPTAKAACTLIDTPSFPYPIPMGLRARFATALPLVTGQTVVPTGPFQDFLPTDTTHTVTFDLQIALDPDGPYTTDTFVIDFINAIPPSALNAGPDRWPKLDIHAAQLRLTARGLSSPLFVEAWATPVTDISRAGLRGDVSDLSPGYPQARVTSVNCGNVSQVILAPFDRRTQFLVVNDSPDETLISFSEVCSTGLYTARIPGQTTVTFLYESFVPGYRGVVSAITPGEIVSGSLKITEGFI